MSALIMQVRHSASLLVSITLSSTGGRAGGVFCAAMIAMLVGVLRQARYMACVGKPVSRMDVKHSILLHRLAAV